MGWRETSEALAFGTRTLAGADRSAGVDEAERKSDRDASRKPRGAIALARTSITEPPPAVGPSGRVAAGVERRRSTRDPTRFDPFATLCAVAPCVS